MPQYERALVYDIEGNFRGNTILKNIQGGSAKLHSVHLWSDDELDNLIEHLERSESLISIKSHWPRQDDPEVEALLQNPVWEPAKLEATEEVDEDQSYIVRKDDDTIDYGASVIVSKMVMAPSRTSVSERVRKAMEVIATQRANA